jgi:hypothetical protein
MDGRARQARLYNGKTNGVGLRSRQLTYHRPAKTAIQDIVCKLTWIDARVQPRDTVRAGNQPERTAK